MNIETVLKVTKNTTLKEKTLVNILYTANRINDMLEQTLAGYRLLPQHYNILRILRGKHPEAVSMGDIKKVMLDKNPDLTRLCTKMLSSGLILKGANTTNKRQQLVTISTKGLELLESLNEKITQLHNHSIGISDDKLEILNDLLDQSRINWEQ